MTQSFYSDWIIRLLSISFSFIQNHTARYESSISFISFIYIYNHNVWLIIISSNLLFSRGWVIQNLYFSIIISASSFFVYFICELKFHINNSPSALLKTHSSFKNPIITTLITKHSHSLLLYYIGEQINDTSEYSETGLLLS